MKKILVKVKEGHKIDGEAETLGKDYDGKIYTYWKSAGYTEVPIELAIKLEKEVPPRFEVVDRNYIKFIESLFSAGEIKQGEEPIVYIPTPPPAPLPEIKPEPKKLSEDITLKEIKEMTKDKINDWAAKRDYEVNTSDTKKKMTKKLVKQIEKRTGQKVR